MARKYIEETIKPKVNPPSETELKNYYAKVESVINGSTEVLKSMDQEDGQALVTLAQRIKELSAEQVRTRYILFKTDKDMTAAEKAAKKKAAEQAVKDLKNGADFRELAKKLSDDKDSAARGGDSGFIIRGWMPKQFDDAAFTVNVGDIDGPLETENGYYVLRVEEKKARQTVSFDDVKTNLAQYLAAKRFRREIAVLVKDLRDKADIKLID
jgi:peptidyl-prolyl cis-trans isomerase D